MLTKNKISEILSNVHFDSNKEDIISNGSVKNIVVFDKEIIIDLEILKPTLQAKNTIKRKIIVAIKNNIDFDVDVKINFILISEKEPTIFNSIKKIENISNIVAISSGKGGVGKSTVTANLAVSLSKMGFKVGILDADIYGPSIPEMFDVSGQKPLAVDVNGKSKMKPIENYGVKILSIGFFATSPIDFHKS